MSRQAAARELRAEVAAAANGGADLDADDLVGRLAPPPEAFADLDDPLERRRYADAVLVQHGLRPEPSLAQAPDGGAVHVHVTRELAIQGAVLLGAAAVVLGALAYWVYGLAFAVAAVAALALVGGFFGPLDRLVPREVPRGRMFGVAVALPLVLVALVAVVLPVRQARKDDAGRSSAAGLVRQADDALRKGDLSAATSLLDRAVGFDPAAPGIESLRVRLVVERLDARIGRRLAALERARRERGSASSGASAP